MLIMFSDIKLKFETEFELLLNNVRTESRYLVEN